MKLKSGKYFGQTIDSLSISGLILTEKIHPSGDILPAHYHENAYFCLALNGGWKEFAEGDSFECHTGNVVYHPKEEIHQTYFQKQQYSKTFNIEITPLWFNSIASFENTALAKRIVCKDRSLNSYLSKIYIEFKRNDQFSGLAIECSFSELFIHLSRRFISYSTTKQARWLYDVKSVITNNFLSPLSLSELAKMFQVHPVYLSKSFKKEFGLTITELYRKCRIDEACRLLKDSQLSLVQIALQCGFYDQSHFCKYFQMITGLSPLAFRKSSCK